MHAFVSYHAFLENVKLFADVPLEIRNRAREIALTEVAPAIARTHPDVSAEVIESRALDLLERFYNPYFNDTVARGVRGAAEKLAPGERLRGGVDYILRAGLNPSGYASTIAAAEAILRDSPPLPSS